MSQRRELSKLGGSRMGDRMRVTRNWLATGTVTFGLIGAVAYAAERPASLTFSGPVPPQYTVGPDEGSKFGVHDHITLRADLAERLSHICEANAKAHGGSATIVILDPYGQIIHEHRMDGQSVINQKSAENKARTSLLSRAPSHGLTNR